MSSMPRDVPYTRREGDQLAARIESIDAHGTRGMQLLSERVAQQSRDLAAMRQEVHDRFAEHTMQHEAEQLARTGRHRWAITAVIAAVSALAAILGLLISIASQLGAR